MKKSYQKICAIITILLTASCATPYQQQSWDSFRGGYSEIKLDANSFKIVFNGNGYTPIEKVKDYALLRSAEVTQNNNFKFFEIDNTEAKFVMTTSQSCYNGICTPVNNSSPTAMNVISCYNDKPKNDNKIYESESVVNEIRKKYNIKN